MLPANNNLQCRLRAFRKKAGFSQQKLAAFVGVSQVAISAYETNKIQPTILIASKIALAVARRVDEIWLYVVEVEKSDT